MKKVIKALITIVLVLLIISVGAVLINIFRTNSILDSIDDVYDDSKYEQKVSANGTSLVKQDVSCGYAVIEMFAKWTGNNDITEKSLYDKYGKVVTSTGKKFEEEMNKQFPEYKTTMYKYLKNTELIDKVYTSLSNGIPVPVEWAAKLEGEWTLHYSLVTAMDIPNDKVTILNPYGYEENISLDEFVDRTSFYSYSNMPIYLRLGFAFGIFEKNTIYIIEKR